MFWNECDCFEYNQFLSDLILRSAKGEADHVPPGASRLLSNTTNSPVNTEGMWPTNFQTYSNERAVDSFEFREISTKASLFALDVTRRFVVHLLLSPLHKYYHFSVYILSNIVFIKMVFIYWLNNCCLIALQYSHYIGFCTENLLALLWGEYSNVLLSLLGWFCVNFVNVHYFSFLLIPFFYTENFVNLCEKLCVFALSTIVLFMTIDGTLHYQLNVKRGNTNGISKE